MPNAFAGLTDLIFANPEFARPAVYQGPNPGDQPVTISVIPHEYTPELGGGQRGRRVVQAFEVKISEIAAPREKGAIIWNGVTYRVNQRPDYFDSERNSWLLQVFEATGP